MSNELHFPIRLYENDPDDILLMVSHESFTYGDKKAHNERADRTREFCNWLRKQFPQVATEFRYIGKERIRDPRYSYWTARYKTINTDKHFLAYGLTRAQLMLIKLAWVFKTQNVKLSGFDKYESGDYILDEIPAPSPELIARMASKKKPVEDDA